MQVWVYVRAINGRRTWLFRTRFLFIFIFWISLPNCVLCIFFSRDNELQTYHGNFLLMDNKHRKLFVIKQSRPLWAASRHKANTSHGQPVYGICRLYGNVHGRRHGFDGGSTIWRAERAKKNSNPHLLHTWGHKTEHCTVFFVVIMTSKRLPVANAQQLPVWLLWRDWNCRTLFNELHMKRSW